MQRSGAEMKHFHGHMVTEEGKNVDEVPRFHVSQPLQVIQDLVVGSFQLGIGRIGLHRIPGQWLVSVCDAMTDCDDRQWQTVNLFHKLDTTLNFFF